MKKIFFIILFFTLIVGCKSNDENILRFAYQEKYLLDVNEKNIELNKNITDEYEKFNGLSNFNIPLNKYIFNQNYKIFIGIALENKPLEIINGYKADTTLNIIEVKNHKNNLNMFCKKNDKFAIKYIFSERKENLTVIVNVVSKDSLLIKKLYDEDKIVSKLQ
ncbi:hypothetical protein [Flavobacterium sp.]|uniref:hypothetical protein n=1 Tax=Flavobacterium sp. TaxID=239 RepID=UPI00286E23B5|nr:hypothetical protein [Flavobacterium sp.]